MRPIATFLIGLAIGMAISSKLPSFALTEKEAQEFRREIRDQEKTRVQKEIARELKRLREIEGLLDNRRLEMVTSSNFR